MKSICFFIVLWGVLVPCLDTIVSAAILFSVSIRFVCHFVMFLWFYISRQFCVFIIASNALLFHLEICYKKKPLPALKRLFPFGTRHPTSVQALFEVFKNQGIAFANINQHIY